MPKPSSEIISVIVDEHWYLVRWGHLMGTNPDRNRAPWSRPIRDKIARYGSMELMDKVTIRWRRFELVTYHLLFDRKDALSEFALSQDAARRFDGAGGVTR